MKQANIVAIGDEAVGKTKVLHALTKAPFTDDYTPTVTDELLYESGNYKLKLLDTPGSDDYEKLRSLSFHDAKLFLLVFSIDHRRSFDELSKWVDDPLESKCSVRSASSAPVILVGTKSDLRKSESKPLISKKEAEEQAKELDALCYVEVSSKTGDNVTALLEQILKSLNSKGKEGHASEVSSEGLPFEEGLLTVTPFKATNLRSADKNGKSDPFVIVGTFDKDKHFKALAKTKVVKKTLNPVWKQSLQIKLKARNLKHTEGLSLHVVDWDMIGHDDFLGEVSFRWDNVKKIGKKTMKLNEESGGKKVGVTGELEFEIQFKK